MPTTLENLYTPLAAPGPSAGSPPQAASPGGGFTPEQEAMAGSLTGSTPTAPPPTLPVGTGNTMYTGETPGTKSTTTTGSNVAMSEQMLGITDIGTVGGSVGTELIDRAVKLPEAQYEEDVEAAELKAGEAGIETKSGKLKTGKAGAREAKQQDRKQDRADRKQAKKDCRAAGGTRKECREAKQTERTRERKMRRATFDEYQDEYKRAGKEAKGKI